MEPGILVFDFGNVLAHFSHRRAAEQLAHFSPLDVDTICQRVFGSVHEAALDGGEVDLPVFRAELRRLIQATHGSDAELDFAFSNMFSRNDAICDAIPALAQKFRLVLLSNTNAAHAAHFTAEYAQELSHFERLILSHEVRARKPQRRIYQIAQEHAACPPEAIVFLDDRADNIATAQSLGWHAIHYQPVHGLPEPLRLLLP